MNVQRLWMLLIARNREFFRDKAAFGWNLLFPFLIVAGFGLIFGNREYSQFKVGVFPVVSDTVALESLEIPAGFKATRYVKYIGVASLDEGLSKLSHHKIDFLIKNDSRRNEYWVSETSPKGYLVEKLFLASLAPHNTSIRATKQAVSGREIRYVEWLFPGILCMNMMFSTLWGVGYVVVRYRKNGVLKRLRATPLTAAEYLSAQLLSRLFILMFALVVVWIGCDAIFSFTVRGSYLDLLLVFMIGGLSLTALGLLFACRGTSEEFASGILNFVSWPMMFLSEVWFSLEGAPGWIKQLSQFFPLTHMIRAICRIMNDGAALTDVGTELIILAVLTIVCTALGARLFSWHR